VSWWTDKATKALGAGGDLPDQDWAHQALVEDILKRGSGTVHRQLLSGSPNPEFDMDELDHLLTEELGFRLIMSWAPWSVGGSESRDYVREDSFVHCHRDKESASLSCTTANKAVFDCIGGLARDFAPPKVSRGRAYVLVQTQVGFETRSLGVASTPLERGNYSPPVLKAYDSIVADLRSNDPTGRLAVIDGPPGTGKTFIIRGFLNDVPDAIFIFVPVDLVGSLADPNVIGSLIDIRNQKNHEVPTVFVVEDADSCLARRDAGNTGSVSTLLNLGDGIIGSMLDIRLICTTNLQDEELDTAVIRPGRLSQKVHIGPLHGDLAAAIYRRLTGKELPVTNKAYTVADLYIMAKDAGWVAPVPGRRPIGFNSIEALVPGWKR
jgi:hypothetical protein